MKNATVRPVRHPERTKFFSFRSTTQTLVGKMLLEMGCDGSITISIRRSKPTKKNSTIIDKAIRLKFYLNAMTRPKFPQQSQPRLSSDSYKNKRRWSPSRVVLVILLFSIVPIATYFNFTFLKVHHQHRNQHEAVQSFRAKPSQSVSTLSNLPTKPTPTKAGKAKWHFWAATPLFGSFRYSTSAILHFPYMDLDYVYANLQDKGKMKPFDALSSGYPEAVAVKGADIAVPDQHICFSLTRKGFKPDTMGKDASTNQDRVVMMTFPDKEDEWWLGLFDGHGDLGHVTSEYASIEFPKRILSLSSKASKLSQEQTKDLMKQIFEDIDTSLPRDVNVGGSTAISIWKTRDLLYISNLGDSQAFVASFDNSGNNVKLIQTTKPHKPDLPEERARIEAAGGQVELPPLPGYSARVIIPVNPFDAMALAMSRSLGDFDGKKIGVSHEPTTEVLELASLSKELNYVVVAATDGIFDQIPITEVATHIAQSFGAHSSLGLAEATEQLILKSSHKWFDESISDGMFQYRDDISIAVHKLSI